MEGLFYARDGFEKKNKKTANIVEMGPFPKVPKITIFGYITKRLIKAKMTKNARFGVEIQMAKYLRNTTWMMIMVAFNESTTILHLFYAINGLKKKQ